MKSQPTQTCTDVVTVCTSQDLSSSPFTEWVTIYTIFTESSIAASVALPTNEHMKCIENNRAWM